MAERKASGQLADDHTLAVRAATGDAAAQKRVVERLRPRAIRAAATMLGPTDAADGAQNAMIEVIRGLPGFRGEAPLEGWADRIIARSCARALRAQRTARHRMTDIDVDELARSTSSARRRQDAAKLVDCILALLSEGQREILLMKHVAGLSVDEIAVRQQASPNTIKDRLKTARSVVRAAVRREAAKDGREAL